MYIYRAKLDRVIDGDTIDVIVDLGFDVTIKRRLRLKGVNTPELRSKDPDERRNALAAKEYVETTLYDNELVIETFKTRSGKDRRTFGRYVADVFIDVHTVDTNIDSDLVSLSEMLVAKGLAEEVNYG